MSSLIQFFTASRYNDPFSHVELPYVDKFIKPLYNNPVLDNHINELILVIIAYHSVFTLSSILSPLLFPNAFKTLSTKNKVDFHIHVVSMVQSVLILLAIIPLFNDPILSQDRVFGYTPYGGFIATMALGYFIWDTIISIIYVKFFGIGFLIHGLVSSSVFLIGLKPYIMFYAPIFILFEISTPFLNLRWFGIKFPNLFSDLFNLINNAILILIFFFIRICYGWYQAYHLGSDFINASSDERFSLFGALVIMGGNSILNILNLYWFYRMAKVAYAIIYDMITGGNEHDDDKKDI
ncbi:putative TLC domain-containing protein [Wickerhamomyces ciferrii]|uniref:TLC domain-containing protein n=1 Tax=Wickerhamomyces ciferrii (strain ATCC 14091 / BCRC 22168 / CBS 111 / JCM 3599 / NBRC 0793 / NRRL Y-1031 F-60-10) TaxID=1206466 RepID=K0KM71_WICCF|nr:putative TLC domain-containing protein [Wickerhamomyces ciferrii]CCH42479.1 putative TLC domain-containing protein [Wickerhamomyces ciferrii]